MSIRDYQYRAEKYFVDDIQSASIPCTPLSNTLKVLDLKDKAVSEMLIKFLNRKLLLSLLSYVKKECSFSEYLKLAKQEQISRRGSAYAEAKRKAVLQAEAELKMKLASDARMKAAREKQRAFDSDPRNIARTKKKDLQNTLREKYDLEHYIEHHHFPRLMKILQKVDDDIRLQEKDVVWLSLDGEEYFTKPLKIAFHRIEATFYTDEFKNKKDPWLAINASSHYRKCGKSIMADQLLSTIKVKQLKSLKLQSAFYTTHGGVKRDLCNSQAALTLGELAHKLAKNDFRPCTLLGAVNMENGSYDLGQAWYAKAIENGFSEKAMDSELRSIYSRLTKSEKDALRSHLHGIDLQRYKWAK
jgi:hypothetical protein